MSFRSFRAIRSTWVLSLVFVLSLPAVTTRLYASDEIEYFAWLRSWVFDHDVDFENEYQHFYDAGVVDNALFHETFLERINETGRRLNFTPIGCALLWAPFYAVGHLVARATGAPADGFSQPYIAAVAYGSAVYGFLAVLLSLSMVRRIQPGGLLPVVAVWIGTPLLFYMYVAPGFAHACSAFAVSLFLWTWLRVRPRWTPAGAAVLGFAAALMSIVREQDLLFVAGPALDFVRMAILARGTSPTASRGPRHVFLAGLAGAVAFALGYLPQALAYAALNGQATPTEVATRKMTWTSPHFFSVLLSPEHGLFFWTPLALVGVLGLVWLAAGRLRLGSPDTRWLGVLTLVMFALQVYISGAVESWTVAGAFGQRRFVALTPLLALGLAVLARRASTAPRAGRALLAAVIGVCLWWNLGLMAQFGLHTMDRQRLSLSDNARGVFIDLPRVAPSLVYRYLADRASFYGVPRQ